MNERLKTHSKTQKKSADLVSNKLRIGVFQRYQMKCKSVSKKSPRYNYYSPDSLSSGIQSYEEANAGARYTIMRPLSIEAGYRYLNLAGKDGNRDNAIADGPYVGVNASF
ncbi:YfaZ family outer membrane protein [Escherichia albertii]|uniref:YfaZ family outer membrane protein n=1 Tax=Escherichia albertii TaxID=208962 RepID=UPI001F14E8AB|nr:YfaZ family outer membrane protein [Escherichia albertii]MCZ8553448.1 YfaZ family outer membrane protein [Escherichia albertii]MCZ8557737.1 YfaZ family outer membrane protein [Escherichia albertii]MCZ8566374.1 YfaZ family outer membrane protein [Escherichia albertii]MCZ8575073.1 YfaZ family outer membrane protein [Escherichia albertii]MCZ8583435.1 YfaZ family outer membrane protein [Escherichia albertii]